MQGRNINLSEFIISRSCELQNLHQILNQPFPNKTPAQSVPRTLRRRNMSHNRYRIPSRLRVKQPPQKAKVYTKAYCRKHIRKAQVLQGLYKSRENQGFWMETHIYQTKRARMENYFGYKIATKYNEKNLRAAYRFSSHDAIIHDLSYYGFITLSGDKVQNLLDKYTKDLDIFQNKYKSGKIWKHLNFSINGQFIGQLQVVWKNNNTLLMIVHPGCQLQIYQELVKNEWNVLVEKIFNQINIFQFKGPKSVYYLQKLFQTLDIKNNLTELFDHILDPNVYPRNAVYYGSCPYEKKNKIQQFPKGKDDSFQNPETFMEKQNELQNIYQKLYTFQQNEPVSDIWKTLLQERKDLKLQKFKTIQRARFTHKKVPPKPSVKKEVDQKIQEIEKMDIEIQSKPAILDFVLLFEKGPLPGFKLLLKQGDANYIWRLLNYLNIVAVGLTEYQHTMHESGELIFPDDFPESPAFEVLNSEKSQKLSEKWDNKPPAKRVNFGKINSPYKFRPEFPLNTQLSQVKIHMLGRGVPSTLGYICLPKEQDLQILKDQMDFGVIHTEPHSDQDIQQNEDSIEPSREIIGFITTGGYSYKNTKGFGIGSLFKEHAMLRQGNSLVVLIRKNTSRYYFAGLCELYQG